MADETTNDQTIAVFPTAAVAALRVRAEKAEAALNEARFAALFAAGVRGGPGAWRWPGDPMGKFLSNNKAWERMLAEMGSLRKRVEKAEARCRAWHDAVKAWSEAPGGNDFDEMDRMVNMLADGEWPNQ